MLQQCAYARVAAPFELQLLTLGRQHTVNGGRTDLCQLLPDCRVDSKITTDIGGTIISGTVTYDGTASISVKIADSVVAAGETLSVDASALTDTNTLTWNGAAETDGAFSIVAGSSASTLTGGACADTFDFTVSGVVFSSADTVNGGAGSDIMKIGTVTATTAFNNVANVESISFANQAAVSITTVDSLVASGKTLSVDATALTGSNTFTWNGASESDDKYSIKAGSSNATITGGSGADTIVAGSGTNWICGGPGIDTITLGSGADTLVFNSLTGTDGISGFTYSADTLTFSVSGVSLLTSGISIITLAGTTVTASSSVYYTMGNSTLTGSASTSAVLSVITGTIASSSALLTRLATGGTNAVILSSACSKNSLLLVLYSDGTDAHMVAVGLGTVGTTFTTSDLTVYEIATLKGITITSLTDWTAIRLALTN